MKSRSEVERKRNHVISHVPISKHQHPHPSRGKTSLSQPTQHFLVISLNIERISQIWKEYSMAYERESGSCDASINKAALDDSSIYTLV